MVLICGGPSGLLWVWRSLSTTRGGLSKAKSRACRRTHMASSPADRKMLPVEHLLRLVSATVSPHIGSRSVFGIQSGHHRSLAGTL
jgi:hypothetical protein